MSGRDYAALVRRLEALQTPLTASEIIGEADGYPIYCVRLEKSKSAVGNILLSGGLHGDEYASPAAVLAFLERENKDGKDLNRCFGADEEPLVRLVKKNIREQRFNFHIDFHEDWEGEATYIAVLLDS